MAVRKKKANPELVAIMAKHGVKLEIPKPLPGGTPRIEIKARIGAVNDLLAKRKGLPVQDRTNHGELARVYSDDRKDFTGGTVSDLERSITSGVDMKPYQAAQAKLSKDGVLKRVSAKLAEIHPKRKRRMSEHDGEWDFDRKWEITPFAATYRDPQSVKTLEIVCDFSISCRARAEDIDQYGAFAWALSDLIEKAGIQTRIVLQNRTRRLTDDGSHNGEIQIEVKRAGEYVAPALIAAGMQSNFLRRHTFGLIVLSAEAVGRAVDDGLGSPEQGGAAIRFENGRLYLQADSFRADPAAIEREIMAAIGAK